MNYNIKKSEILFRGNVFNLRVDELEYFSGNRGTRETAVHPGGAVVVPVKNNGNIILVRQFRHPFQKLVLEFPAGKLDSGEDPYNCAVRELEEETGYKSNDVVKLGEIYTTPGFSTEILHIYYAKNMVSGKHNREEGEYGMEIHEYSLEEIEEMITNGDIVDAKTICGIHLYRNKILKS